VPLPPSGFPDICLARSENFIFWPPSLRTSNRHGGPCWLRGNGEPTGGRTIIILGRDRSREGVSGFGSRIPMASPGPLQERVQGVERLRALPLTLTRCSLAFHRMRRAKEHSGKSRLIRRQESLAQSPRRTQEDLSECNRFCDAFSDGLARLLTYFWRSLATLSRRRRRLC